MRRDVREATPDDADGVVRLLDAAMLEFDRERVRRRVDAGSALVAVVEGYGDAAAGRDGDARRSQDGGVDRDGGDSPSDGAHSSASDAGDSSIPDDRVVGVCVLGEVDVDATDYPTPVADAFDVESPATEIEQIAIHRSRRGRGIGTALVRAAAARAEGPLAARFREQVRPFYESLGFDIRRCEGRGAGSDADDRDDDSVGGRDRDGGNDRLCGVLG